MAYLLFATELYAVPILRPLAAAARARGARTGWVVPDAVAPYLHEDEPRLIRHAQVRALAPRAVFSAANWAPPAFPGAKVQLFHGFNAEKRDPGRGHFRLRGYFDLYCTQGPSTTAPFRELAREHGYFAVEETGWPKLDPMFAGTGQAAVDALRAAAGDRTCIAFASTFTESLSAAPAMYDTVARAVAEGEFYWLLTLHPKSSDALRQRYRALAEAHPRHARYVESDRLLDMLRAGDVMICDTSSAIDEFAVQLKPVVTLDNRRPKPFMLDVHSPAEVLPAVRQALMRAPAIEQALRAHADAIHPQRDGHASERVLDATERFLAGGFGPLRRKPLNLWRRWQSRTELARLLPG